MIKKNIFLTIFICIIFVLAFEKPPELVTKSWWEDRLHSKIYPMQVKLQGLEKKLERLEKQIQTLQSVLPREIIVRIDSKTANVEGRSVELDVPAQIVKGRTYVPLRFIGEALEADFKWYGNLRKVVYSHGEDRVELFIDSTTAVVNCNEVNLADSPFIKNDRTLVPLRFLAETLHAEVNWNQETRTVIITSGANF